MTTTMINVNGLDLYVVPVGFVFVRQNCVKFYGKRLSKSELILCCNHFISELKIIYSPDRLKIGFNLNTFKYYELSVYLHGLISLICSKIQCSCPSCFGIYRFSHLPHDILKPEKGKREFVVALVDDFYLGRYFVCVINGKPVCSTSLKTLKAQVFLQFPSVRDYDINFVVK